MRGHCVARLIVASIFFITMLTLMNGCGGSRSGNTNDPTLTEAGGEGLAPQPTGGTSLAEALAELEALSRPDGVDPWLWQELTTKLAKVLASRSVSEILQHPPDGDHNCVTDLALVGGGEGSYSLEWTYVNCGDYNLDGLVSIHDITAIGQYYLSATGDPDWAEAQRADGNGDGMVTINDITPIGQNYLAYLASYNIYGCNSPGGTWDQLGAAAFDTATGDTQLSFSYVVGSHDYGYYQVVPADGTDVEGTASELLRANLKPTAVLSADKTSSYLPFIINFDASASTDLDGGIVQYEFDFDGDNVADSAGGSPLAAHTYQLLGLNRAQLRVTDVDGAQDTAVLHITLPSEWPMFGMDPQQQRRSPYVGAQTNNVKWSCPVTDYVLTGPVIAADGTVYVANTDHELYAINPDGSLRWSYDTGSIMTSPAIGADGTLYCGTLDPYNELLALNPDGSFKAWYPLGDVVRDSPTVGPDGIVYAGSDYGLLLAIDPDGDQDWSYNTYGSGVSSSPALGPDGTVYFGTYDEKLYAINPGGSTKWCYPTPSYAINSLAISDDGTIYAACHWKLHAIDPDGSLKWSYDAGGDIFASPAIGAEGTIYVASGADKLHAINPDGSPKWSYTVGSSIHVMRSSPAIGADGTIYVGSNDHKLQAINPDGTLKWSYTVGGDWLPMYSSPAIGADGTVYVGSGSGKLYAFGPSP